MIILTLSKLFDEIYWIKRKNTVVVIWWKRVYLFWDMVGLWADLFSSISFSFSILSYFLKSQAQSMPRFKCCSLNLTKHIFLISVCLYMINKVQLFWILHHIHDRAHCSVLSCDTSQNNTINHSRFSDLNRRRYMIYIKSMSWNCHIILFISKCSAH